MFSVKQTRFIILMSFAATVLLCFIGLNWQKKEETAVEVVSKLEVPEIEPGSASDTGAAVREDDSDFKTINLGETSGRKKEQEAYEGELEDEGKTIILE